MTQQANHQVYGIATYDALFKYVLSQDEIRPSFFQAFIPDLTIQSSQRLDDHMNPFQDLQLLRDFIHRQDTSHTVKRLTSSSDLCVGIHPSDQSLFNKDSDGTVLLHEILSHFEDIQRAFPKVKYDGTMDFVCKLDNGEYAMVEMQVLPEDSWDRRALAYVAFFYGNQLRKGGHWERLRKVIGINILGGGKEDKQHWPETPDQYVRHYKFQEQLHPQAASKRYLDGIELIQYSIMNAPTSIEDQEKEDWITFFKRGHRMNEEEVKNDIKTEAVQQAFELAKLAKLPKEIKAIYDEEDYNYQRYSQHTQDLVNEGVKKAKAEGIAEGIAEGKAEGIAEGKAEEREKAEQEIRLEKEKAKLEKLEIAQKMIATGMSKEMVSQITGFSLAEINAY